MGANDGIGQAGVPAATRRRAPTTKTRTARRKPTRWSAAVERKFLAALVETLNIAASARIARISETSVYRHRQQSEAFRAAWRRAMQDAYAQLELQLLERAVKGVARPVFYGGKRIASVKEFSERSALALLARRRAAEEEEDGEALPVADEAEVRARMTRRLEEMATRLAGAGVDGSDVNGMDAGGMSADGPGADGIGADGIASGGADAAA